MRGLGSHAGPVSLIHPRKENVKNLKNCKLFLDWIALVILREAFLIHN